MEFANFFPGTFLGEILKESVGFCMVDEVVKFEIVVFCVELVFSGDIFVVFSRISRLDGSLGALREQGVEVSRVSKVDREGLMVEALGQVCQYRQFFSCNGLAVQCLGIGSVI